jgi:hypothetical protein
VLVWPRSLPVAATCATRTSSTSSASAPTWTLLLPRARLQGRRLWLCRHAQHHRQPHRLRCLVVVQRPACGHHRPGAPVAVPGAVRKLHGLRVLLVRDSSIFARGKVLPEGGVHRPELRRIQCARTRAHARAASPHSHRLACEWAHDLRAVEPLARAVLMLLQARGTTAAMDWAHAGPVLASARRRHLRYPHLQHLRRLCPHLDPATSKGKTTRSTAVAMPTLSASSTTAPTPMPRRGSAARVRSSSTWRIRRSARSCAQTSRAAHSSRSRSSSRCPRQSAT